MTVFMFPETRYRRTSVSSGISSSVVEANNKASDKPTTATTHAPIDGPSSRPVGKPSKAQFSLVPVMDYEGSALLIRDVLTPIQIFFFPIVFWVVMSFCFSTNCLLALNLTQSQVFAAPPYLFGPAQVGFLNFAFVVGGIIGLLTAGPFSDWVSMRATKRNGGVREAEMRLIALVPYILLCLVGMVVSFPKLIPEMTLEIETNLYRSLLSEVNALGHGRRLLSSGTCSSVSKSSRFPQS